MDKLSGPVQEYVNSDLSSVEEYLVALKIEDPLCMDNKLLGFNLSKTELIASLRAESETTQFKLADWLAQSDQVSFLNKGKGLLVIHHYLMTNCLIVASDKNSILELSKSDLVSAISFLKTSPLTEKEKMPRRIVEENNFSEFDSIILDYKSTFNVVKHLKAPELWCLGLDGSGVVCGVIDTGINYSHDYLEHSIVDYEGTFGRNFQNPGSLATDHTGHGTKCAGLIAGTGPDEFPIGIAPKAKIINLKIAKDDQKMAMDAFNHAINEDMLDVLSWSMSWGYSDVDGNVWRNASVMALKRGLLVVNSAGELGTSACGSNASWRIPKNIDPPGDAPPPYRDVGLYANSVGISGAVSVGASITTKNGDKHFEISGVGPCEWNRIPYNDFEVKVVETDKDCDEWFGGVIKPDLCAPGKFVPTANPDFIGSHNLLTEFTGTSAAAPIVAGAFCLLIQARKKMIRENQLSNAYDPGAILLALELGCVPMEKQNPLVHKSNKFGAGRIDILCAYEKGKNQGLWE